jgi:MerR family transcriptional regulator, repressor of the yfmOP operon
MNTQAAEIAYRIGEVAERVGVTTRTIRYYEELGLLGSDAERPKGAHRLYSETNITRLQELIRLRDLLGLSLDELVELAEAEEACAMLCNEWEQDPDDDERLRILEEAKPLLEHQLELVRLRLETLGHFAGELEDKLRTVDGLTAELGRRAVVSAP